MNVTRKLLAVTLDILVQMLIPVDALTEPPLILFFFVPHLRLRRMSIPAKSTVPPSAYYISGT